MHAWPLRVESEGASEGELGLGLLVALDAVIEIKVVVGAPFGATVEVEGAIVRADGAVDGEEAGQVGDINVPLKMAARRPLFAATGLEPVVDDELIEEENVVDRRLVLIRLERPSPTRLPLCRARKKSGA